MIGTIIKDSVSDKTELEKYKTLTITTNIIFGMKEEIVKPYNEDIKDCLLAIGTVSILIFSNNIAETKPMVKTQKRISIAIFKPFEGIYCVMDRNQ
jgi:hypothetical protein